MNNAALRFRVDEHIAAGIAAGATMGNRHLQRLLERLPKDLLATTTVLIDFDGIEGLTPSWVKAFLVPLLASAERKNETKVPERDAARVEVFVVNLGEDLVQDLDAALIAAGRPCLEALAIANNAVEAARLHGPVEDKILSALESLRNARRGTAAELREFDQTIGVSGWHYRLMELQRLGLARRVKSGRSWVYEPVVKEVTRG